MKIKIIFLDGEILEDDYRGFQNIFGHVILKNWNDTQDYYHLDDVREFYIDEDYKEVYILEKHDKKYPPTLYRRIARLFRRLKFKFKKSKKRKGFKK